LVVKQAEEAKKNAPTEEDASEEEKAKKLKDDIQTLAEVATKKRDVKDVKKFTEAVESDPTSEIKKEELKKAKAAV